MKELSLFARTANTDLPAVKAGPKGYALSVEKKVVYMKSYLSLTFSKTPTSTHA